MPNDTECLLTLSVTIGISLSVKREEKKGRTRAELSAAAHELFAEVGFDSATADAIADRAGVSRRTFFRYFETKEAVFFADDEARFARFERELAERSKDETAFASVRRLLLELAGELMLDRKRARLHHRLLASSKSLSAHDLELDMRWEAAIAEALAKDPRSAAAALLPAPLGAKMMAGAIMGVVRAGLRDWFEGGARGDLVERAQFAFQALENGFRPASTGRA